MSISYRVVQTEAGFVGLVASPAGLRRVTLPVAGRAAARAAILQIEPNATEDATILPELAAGLKRYFFGEAVSFVGSAFDWSGRNNFEVDTWLACARVPYGQTTTYKALAERLGCPGGARAVGSAMAHNPCPIVVPCHRVLKSDGSLGGWSGPGGLDEKRRYLDMEASVCGELLEKK